MRDGGLNSTLLVSTMEDCLLLCLQELSWALSLTKRKQRETEAKWWWGKKDKENETHKKAKKKTV